MTISGNNPYQTFVREEGCLNRVFSAIGELPQGMKFKGREVFLEGSVIVCGLCRAAGIAQSAGQ
jgi:hypothetical protein